MVKALIFDVFGTCVDWRRSVAREVATALPDVDPIAFTVDWRREYQPSMAPIRSGERDYIALDALHRENLDKVLERYSTSCETPHLLNKAWESLDPWPDVQRGLNWLKRDYIIAPCSNGSIALMTHLARYAGLPWDRVLGAEIAQAYKPDEKVYLTAVAALQLEPKQVAMVAAHNDDLFAARRAGLRTAFVARPEEHGPDQTTDLEPESDWDWVAKDFLDLAKQLEPA